MTAYYNEIDPYAAQWLRNLAVENLIAPGDVDTRDIRDIAPGDLAGYAQCHFFAGIGGWSRALRLAGVPDDFPVWTGSCPCQPFSQAGKGGGFADERHLWPYWHHLIRIRRPDLVFGEQVASPDGLAWFDLVHADLEGEAYAVGASDLCAAGVQAPHIRQRLWFVADARRARAGRNAGDGASTQVESDSEGSSHGNNRSNATFSCGTTSGMAQSASQQWRLSADARRTEDSEIVGNSATSSMGNLGSTRLQERIGNRRIQHQAVGSSAGQAAERGSDVGFWSDAEWLPCTDGKSRPVEPGTFPLASGVPARVAKLRAFGNAIVPQAAAEFIKAALTPPM